MCSPGKKAPAEDKIVLNILLNCELTKSSEIRQIQFQSLPTTPLEVKKKIEKDFSIPSCVQTLHYQSMILKDSDQLQNTHFRSGDTFTVDYPIEAECEMVQNVLKWLKELFELSKIHISFPNGEDDPSVYSRIENLILDGERDGITEELAVSLFHPWEDKKKLMNKFYFQQEGGLDMLMTVYGVLVSKEWGDLGIEKYLHVYLERKCCQAVVNYAQTFPLSRQIVQLRGLEICTATLLRRQLHKDGTALNHLMYITLRSALIALCNLSELPECQVPLAMKADVIEQILAIALHPAYDCYTSKVSVETILNLTQHPESHAHIVRKEFVETMLEMSEQRYKMISQQSAQALNLQGRKEDPMVINALKFNTGIVLAQVGLGSPHLLLDSIPPHLLQQTLCLLSDILETASPAEIRQHDKILWGTFLPYLRYLYKPSAIIESVTAVAKEGDTRTYLHITCCNVLLYGLETVLGGYVDHHLEILVKEGLFDYTVCLPAVLPGECQPRARSLVNELGKYRQLQPPSLCTLAKAHIAKTFCGLQPVMAMNSIGEFVYKYFLYT